MSSSKDLSKELQLKEEIRKRDDIITELKEQLEYFTDKYGLPSDWNTVNIEEDLKDAEKLISKEAKDQERDAEVIDLHRKLVADSTYELLRIQLSDLMTMLSDHNKNTIQIYNSITALKEKMRTINTNKK